MVTGIATIMATGTMGKVTVMDMADMGAGAVGFRLVLVEATEASATMATDTAAIPHAAATV